MICYEMIWIGVMWYEVMFAIICHDDVDVIWYIVKVYNIIWYDEVSSTR